MEDPPKPAVANPSLLTRLADLIKLAGIAYAIGFTVILTHTARLNAPIIEAFQFQNILAGLPLWFPLLAVALISPRLSNRLSAAPVDATRKMTFVAVFGASLVICVASVYFSCRFLFGFNFSWPGILIFFLAVAFAAILSVLVQFVLNQRTSSSPETILLQLGGLYAGAILLVLLYALFAYPHLPQSIGGGRPVPIRLYLKDSDPSKLLPAPDTNPVQLYYRSSSSVLISRSPGQPLIQIPTDQIRAIVWLDSKSQ